MKIKFFLFLFLILFGTTLNASTLDYSFNECTQINNSYYDQNGNRVENRQNNSGTKICTYIYQKDTTTLYKVYEDNYSGSSPVDKTSYEFSEYGFVSSSTKKEYDENLITSTTYSTYDGKTSLLKNTTSYQYDSEGNTTQKINSTYETNGHIVYSEYFSYESNKISIETEKWFNYIGTNYKKVNKYYNSSGQITKQDEFNYKDDIDEYFTTNIYTDFYLEEYFETYSGNRNDLIEEFEVKAQNIDSPSLIFLGDSITYNSTIEECTLGNINCVNMGVPSDTTFDLLYRFDENIKSIDQSYVEGYVVTIGTNDLLLYPQYGIDIDYLFYCYNKLIQEIQEISDAPIYVVSVLPCNDTYYNGTQRSNETIHYVNSYLSNLPEYYSNVAYIDLHSQVEDANGELKIEYTNDGLHLNKTGYKFVAEILYDYFDNIFGLPSSPMYSECTEFGGTSYDSNGNKIEHYYALDNTQKCSKVYNGDSSELMAEYKDGYYHGEITQKISQNYSNGKLVSKNVKTYDYITLQITKKVETSYNLDGSISLEKYYTYKNGVLKAYTEKKYDSSKVLVSKVNKNYNDNGKVYYEEYYTYESNILIAKTEKKYNENNIMYSKLNSFYEDNTLTKQDIYSYNGSQKVKAYTSKSFSNNTLISKVNKNYNDKGSLYYEEYFTYEKNSGNLIAKTTKKYNESNVMYSKSNSYYEDKKIAEEEFYTYSAAGVISAKTEKFYNNAKLYKKINYYYNTKGKCTDKQVYNY